MNDGPIVRRISFDIHGEFITQLAREWFYTGEKSHEKVIEILMDSMTGNEGGINMAVRTQPDALKVFAAIAMIVNSREDSAKVKLTSVTRKTEKEEKRSA